MRFAMRCLLAVLTLGIAAACISDAIWVGGRAVVVESSGAHWSARVIRDCEDGAHYRLGVSVDTACCFHEVDRWLADGAAPVVVEYRGFLQPTGHSSDSLHPGERAFISITRIRPVARGDCPP